MAKKPTLFLVSFWTLSLGLNPVCAQQRELLFSKSLSPHLQDIVRSVRNLQTPKVEKTKMSAATDYYVRIAPRANVLNSSNQILTSSGANQLEALLGTKPFIFLTSPEGIYGRSLLEIYEDIGYEAEDIIRLQHNQDMVAVVFRYPAKITFSPEIKDGILPQDWDAKIYVPLWDNVFALFYRLAENATIEPEKKDEFSPYHTFFRSTSEKAFVLSYAEGARHKIKNFSYGALKANGGADWVYRKLLEDKLGLFEHFRGTGQTQNEVRDPNNTEAGLLEFLGPNKSLQELPEVAVIHLGKLAITDSYTK